MAEQKIKIYTKEKYKIIKVIYEQYIRRHAAKKAVRNERLTINILCEIAGVSRSGYHKWLSKSNAGSYRDRDYEDYLKIKEVFDKGKGKYGWRQVKMSLERDSELIMNHKKIRRIMKKYRLTAKIRRANPYKQIAKATKEHQIFENILERKFSSEQPFKVLGTDITYLYYNKGQKAYLSVIKDFATGEIVAWETSRTLEMPIVLNTVAKLKSSLGPDVLRESLLHSDQGFHYTNPRYIKELKELLITQSMSRRGNCIDNAPTESFFGHFKDDVDFRNCKTFDEIISIVDQYIHYYNTGRYQWNLKKMTPVEYRNHLLVA